jgi:hypothetical protein
VFLPLHRNDRFPSSVLEPGSGSRHLYAGHHLGSKQVSPRFYPEVANSLGFDVAYTVSTLRQWFTCVRLSDPYMTCLATPFPVTFTTMALDQRSLRLFEACSYKPASEGRPPSLEQHRARFLTVLRVPGTHSPTVSIRHRKEPDAPSRTAARTLTFTSNPLFSGLRPQSEL